MTAAAAAGAETPAWIFVVVALSIGGAAWFVVSLWSADGRTPYDRLCGTRMARAAG